MPIFSRKDSLEPGITIASNEDFIRRRLIESDFNHSFIIPAEPQLYINDPIDIYPYSPSSYLNNEGLKEENLAFIEMKIENKNEYMIVNIIYIDKSTYEEVIRSYKCNVSISKENYHSFSLSENDSDQANMNIKLENMGPYKETRKQL